MPRFAGLHLFQQTHRKPRVVQGFVSQLMNGGIDSNPLTLPYSIYAGIWSISFLETWKRRENELKFTCKKTRDSLFVMNFSVFDVSRLMGNGSFQGAPTACRTMRLRATSLKV